MTWHVGDKVRAVRRIPRDQDIGHRNAGDRGVIWRITEQDGIFVDWSSGSSTTHPSDTTAIERIN